MGKYRKILLIAFVDAFASLIGFNILIGGFRIMLSVVLLPIYYFFDRKLNPLLCGFAVGVVGLMFRGIVGIPNIGFSEALQVDFPIFIFDMTYAMVYYFFFYMKEEEDQSVTRWVIVVMMADFIGNVFEVATRIGPLTEQYVGILNDLLVIAGIRAFMAVTIVLLLQRYQMLLKRQEHESRYRDLLTMISELKSEIYYMSGNMEYIEAVMADAFELYEAMDGKGEYEQHVSLKIAKDVHEIKKNYVRVIKGIEQIMVDKEGLSDMRLKDIYLVLQTNLMREYPSDAPGPKLTVHVRTNEKVSEHFMLMSILRNLTVNALEALKNREDGLVDINHERSGEDHIILIQDNGPGIKERDLEHIFDPGFSTKFDAQTGDIYRGLGLTLVRDIVEKKFGGTIDVQSIPGAGTTFTVTIPNRSLEGHHEILSN